MITTKLYLRTPNKEKSAICIEIRKNNERIRLSSEIIIPTQYWDSEKKALRKNCPDYIFLSQKLISFTAIVAREITLADIEDLSLEQLKESIVGKTNKSYTPTINKDGVVKFYRWWAMTEFGEHHPTRQNWNHFVVFEEFIKMTTPEGEIPFESIDYEFYLKFKAFLDNNKGYKPNTTSTHLRDLKAIMTEARNRGKHNSSAYLAIKKKFENVDTTYMTIDEINRLYKMRLLGARAMARDLFVLGCHTAMRYSDYSKLSMAHISKGNIVYKTQKTDTTVIIPAHPRVIEILERWGGSAPPISQTSLNKIIKEVCQELGIFNDLIPVKEGRMVRYMERYNFISTHTARRSGATNMYLAGIPAQSIMKITGHTTEASFMKYLRITKEQNAKLLAENDFFKK